MQRSAFGIQHSVRNASLFAIAFVALSPWSVAQKKPTSKTVANDAPADSTVIRGGKCLTVSHGTIENCTVVIDGGKISYVGVAAGAKTPAGAKVVDASGMTVYP